MTDLVPTNQIELIVGLPRHPTRHFGRAVGARFYILHSKECKDSGIDLRDCAYSRALDRGLWPEGSGPMSLRIVDGWLSF